MKKSSLLGLASLSLLTPLSMVCCAPAQAVTFVENRADLGAIDRVDWSSLGSVFNPALGQFNFPAFTVSATSIDIAASSKRGLGVDVAVPLPGLDISPPLVFINTVEPFGIPAPFDDGDFVLATGLDPTQFPSPGNSGPLSITFAQPVLGAGANFAVDDTFVFDAFISAFDEQDNLLDTFSRPGTASIDPEDFGTAVFLGITSDIANIKRIEFFSSEPNRALGINALSIAVVPEPGMIGMIVALGLLGMGLKATGVKNG